MINFRKATSRDYKIALIPCIILASLSSLMFLWNFVDTLNRAIYFTLNSVPKLAVQDASNMLYVNWCSVADSFCLLLAFLLFIAVLFSIKKAATPFTAFVGNGMRAIAVIEILPHVFSFAAKRVIAAAVTLPTDEYSGYFGIGNVAAMLMFFMISFIFDYGCELQRESDETI